MSDRLGKRTIAAICFLAVALGVWGSSFADTEWETISTPYFSIKAPVGRPFKTVEVNGLTWGDLSDNDNRYMFKTLIRLHEGRLVTLSYHFPAHLHRGYEEIFEKMLHSIVLMGLPKKE